MITITIPEWGLWAFAVYCVVMTGLTAWDSRMKWIQIKQLRKSLRRNEEQ